MRLILTALAIAVFTAAPALAAPLVTYSYGEFYPTHVDAPRLDFRCSGFALPVNGFISDAAEKCQPLRANDVNFAMDFIMDNAYKPDPDKAAALADKIVAGLERGYADFGDDVPLSCLLAHAKFESTLNPTARNIHTGAYGLYQFHPRWHKSRYVEAMGLDWNSPEDQTYYAVFHVQHDIDKGQSLYRACSWWEVRDRGAWALYQKIKREGE